MSHESDYEIIKIIGKGSHGSVYLAKHVAKTDEAKKAEYYVLKKIPIKDCDPSQRAATFQEVDLLRSLSHPNIVNYVDSFLDAQGTHLCIAMEYCAGGDLATKIQQQSKTGKGFPEKQVLEWFVQMTQALEYIHDQHKILHRDIKTQNIFLDAGNAIKLGDFGIARSLGGTQEMARTMVGTPYYMSPEIFTGKPYNHKSDIWALGCCLFEMLTFKQAFDAKDMTTLVTKVLRGNVPPIPSQYNPQLADLLKLLLQKVPSKRPSCATILKHPYIKKFIETSSHASIPISLPSNTNLTTVTNTTTPSSQLSSDKSVEPAAQKENIKNAISPQPQPAAQQVAAPKASEPGPTSEAEVRKRRHSLKEPPRRNSIDPKGIVELKRKPKRSIEPSQLSAFRQDAPKAAPTTPQKLKQPEVIRPKNRQVEALNKHKSRLTEARSPRVSSIPIPEPSPDEKVHNDAMEEETSKQSTPPAEPKQSMFTFIPLNPTTAPSTPSKPPLGPSTPRSTPQSKPVMDNNRNRRESISSLNTMANQKNNQTKNPNPIRAMFERNNKLQPSMDTQTSPSRGGSEDFPVYECINGQDTPDILNSPLIYKQKTKRVRDEDDNGPQKMQHVLQQHDEEVMSIDSEEAEISDDESCTEEMPTNSPFLQGNLSQRIKTITQHCMDGMGRDMFYRVKHFMMKEHNDAIVDKQLREWLGDLKSKQFQPLIAQLIFCEESLQ